MKGAPSILSVAALMATTATFCTVCTSSGDGNWTCVNVPPQEAANIVENTDGC